LCDCDIKKCIFYNINLIFLCICPNLFNYFEMFFLKKIARNMVIYPAGLHLNQLSFLIKYAWSTSFISFKAYITDSFSLHYKLYLMLQESCSQPILQMSKPNILLILLIKRSKWLSFCSQNTKIITSQWVKM